MILLSVHIDVVRDFALEFRGTDHTHVGLLDNWLGVLVTYQTLYAEPALVDWAKRGWLQVYHNRAEEWGLLVPEPPEMHPTRDAVIVVDVADAKEWDAPYDFSIENIDNWPEQKAANIKECLEWEGHKFRWKAYSGDPEDIDEAWSFRLKKVPVMSFIIPIYGPWHLPTCTADLKQVARATLGLRRLINYLGWEGYVSREDSDASND